MIPLLLPQARSFIGMIFQPISWINIHSNIFLHSSYVISRIFTNGIDETTKTEVWYAWVAGKTYVRWKRVRQRTYPCYYMVKYSHTGLEHVTCISAMLLQSDLNKYRLSQLAKYDNLYIISTSTRIRKYLKFMSLNRKIKYFAIVNIYI